MTIFQKFHLGQVGRASFLLAFFYLISRLIGLVRDRVLAAHFGAGNLLDVYYLSFNLPDFIFNLVVAGAVSAAFIPVFIEYQEKKKGEEWSLASNFLNGLLLIVAGSVAVFFFFAPGIISLIAPGFSPEKKDLAVLFTRVMIFSPLIFSISVVFGSLLQVFHRFLAYALAPIMYNLGIIFGALVLEPKFGPLGLAEGVLLGALLHLAVQWPAVWATGFRWRAVFNWSDQGWKKILALTAPRALGLAAFQFNLIVLDALATTLGLGAVAILNFADNLQYLPIALVGISVAVAAFPTLSREALQEDKKKLSERIDQHVRQILLWSVPFSFLFFFLRQEMVNLVLRAGNFSSTDAALTARVLSFFILGVFSQSLVPVLSRSFYALRNTLTPVLISLGSIGINIILAFLGVKVWGWGIVSLPLAFSLAGIFNAVMLSVFLKKKLPSFSFGSLGGYLGRLLLASGGMFGVLIWVSQTGLASGGSLMADLGRSIIYATFALLTFICFSKILRVRFSR